MISFWAKNIKTYFSRKKIFLNQIFNKYVVCMWTARRTTPKNAQKVNIFEEKEIV